MLGGELSIFSFCASFAPDRFCSCGLEKWMFLMSPFSLLSHSYAYLAKKKLNLPCSWCFSFGSTMYFLHPQNICSLHEGTSFSFLSVLINETYERTWFTIRKRIFGFWQKLAFILNFFGVLLLLPRSNVGAPRKCLCSVVQLMTLVLQPVWVSWFCECFQPENSRSCCWETPIQVNTCLWKAKFPQVSPTPTIPQSY